MPERAEKAPEMPHEGLETASWDPVIGSTGSRVPSQDPETAHPGPKTPSPRFEMEI
jgi:hypothetical protein